MSDGTRVILINFILIGVRRRKKGGTKGREGGGRRKRKDRRTWGDPSLL
jgi:hypothetical protein